MSTTATATSSSCTRRRPSSPDSAVVTRKPNRGSSRPSIARIISSSSTTRTCGGGPATDVGSSRIRGSAMRAKLAAIGQGQTNHELGAYTYRRFQQLDLSSVLSHEVVAEGKPEAGALRGWLGRKERLEDAIADVTRDAATVVPHADFGHGPREASRHSHPAAAVDRIQSVEGEIQHHLL